MILLNESICGNYKTHNLQWHRDILNVCQSILLLSGPNAVMLMILLASVLDSLFSQLDHSISIKFYYNLPLSYILTLYGDIKIDATK